MNRIIKGRFHIASRCMAIGSAVSSYAKHALGRMRFVGRDPLDHEPNGLKTRAAAAASTRARGRQKARYTPSTTLLKHIHVD